MHDKIEIVCLEKNKQNNPYFISKILLIKEKGMHYAKFQFKDKLHTDDFLESLRTLLRVNLAEKTNQGILIVNQKEIENTIVIKGNISNAINLLIREGLLRGKDKDLFDKNNIDEKEIQSFLAASTTIDTNLKEYRTNISVDPILDKPEQINRCTFL